MLGELHREQRGQSLIIITLALVATLALAALVVDGGNAYVQRRRMQNAADAGALAGVREICSGGDPEGAAIDYAQRNGGQDVTVSVNTDERTVTVTAQTQFPTFFAGMIGISELTARAEATAQVNCGEYAIWANSETCRHAFKLTGSGGMVHGDAHSNNDVHISGSGHTIEGVCEYVTSYHLTGSGHSVTFVHTSVAPLPAEYNLDEYEAAADYYHEGDFKVSGSGKVLDEGLHYVKGKVKISGSGHSGHVTIVAEGKINVSGSGHNFTAYTDGLLFFSNKSGGCSSYVIKVSGSGNTLNGVIYAPYGKIDFSGSGQAVLNGSLIGDSVEVSGSGFTIEFDYLPAVIRARLTQ